MIRRNPHAYPIGIFDSGVGGLTVVNAIRRKCPHEELVYLGDTARTPYGSKAGETVVRFTKECVRHLLRYRIKALVVACNTASAFALPTLRRNLKIPILGVIEPGARAAVAEAGKSPIGVIGTRATIQSRAYPTTICRLQASSRVYSQPCPLLVPLVEEGWLKGNIPLDIIRKYLRPLLHKKIRSLILGCTHYPALKGLLARVCGSRVRIIDSAEEVAQELVNVLQTHRLQSRKKTAGRQKYLVTDVPEQFNRVGALILGRSLQQVQRVSMGG
ncbi:glutamate racemase [candidate division FCPU426 bacterium]|nr:glutamate racemase [candidate division FCPU426 bacterium]